MDSSIFRSNFSATVFICMILMIFLPSCSQATSNNPGSTTSFVADLNHAPGSNPEAYTDTNGLHVQTSGISCSRSYGPSNLVLATGQLQFDTNAIQQIVKYFNDPPSFSDPLPSVLRWISGGDQCFGDFQITNVGEDTVNITRFGIVITAPPTSNMYRYHLIDACTFGSAAPGCGPGSTASADCEYHVYIHLSGGTGGTKLDAPFIPSSLAGIPCPLPITLNPGDSSEIWASMDNPGQGSQIYNVIPLLTIGDIAITLPKITSTLAFTDSTQFSCYGLQDTIFVQVRLSQHCI